MAELHRAKGVTRVELLVLVGVGLFLLVGIAVPTLPHLRHYAFRMSCNHNLAEIGKAMLVYANDYAGAFPRAGGPASTWGPVTNWLAPNRNAAYNLNPTTAEGGMASISSCFYLLIKYARMTPESFVCPGDAGTSAFSLSGRTDCPRDTKLSDCWDFGAPQEGMTHCSYSYQVPFCLYALRTDDHPGKAVAADRNPWQGSPAGAAGPFPGNFQPDTAPWNGSPEQARQGNAVTHQGDGQNVLFVDGHVEFTRRAYCAVDHDNIYTVSTRPPQGDPLGVAPTVRSCPLSRTDSVLIQDAVAYRATVTHETREINSKDLQQTAVVATLECPLPEHKNVIWCSTFQMAWDQLKRDVIGAPIQVPGAAGLASRLNGGESPARDIEKESYYTAAGFVKDGILGQIRKDMAARFPSHPLPTFDQRYKTLPEVIVAYAYLAVDVGFAHPFYINEQEFSFADSHGTRSSVTSFCAHTHEPDEGVKQVRAQVDVLYYRYGAQRDADEFAVDLCRHTKPYEIILARIPPCGTLGEAVRKVREGITEFADDPNYAVLRSLRPIDSLIVPDVLYKLTHHFDELLGKFLGNPRWQEYFFFEAVQKIDFRLSRTGVVLKSEARLAAAGGMADSRREEPRRLHFDRPFLICVKKRDAAAAPFFAMWVDNTELMNPYRP
jgi:prepilin-type processing-associated H-X9-DG protein